MFLADPWRDVPLSGAGGHTVVVTGEQTSDPFAVLFVCTGNICRSPLAERLGRAYLDELLGDDAGLVRLSSAGTSAVVGSQMHPESALVLQGFGGDSTDFVGRQLASATVGHADLVLTMTRTHRRAVLQAVPRALNRTFTLREAADVAALLEGSTLSGADLPDRARALVREMAAARSRRKGGEDEVPDPINLPIEAHQEAGEIIAAALIPLLTRIAGLRETPVLHLPGSDRKRTPARSAS